MTPTLAGTGLSKQQLGLILFPHPPGLAEAALIERYCDPLNQTMAAREITTALRMAHFLAQVGHESGSLRYAEELASGAAYESRRDLGNTEPGDGVRFKGRGLIQLTGRANYAAYGESKGRDLVTPENYKLIASDALLAADVAGWFWAKHNLNALADLDNCHGITVRINGGTNGLADRIARLERAKQILFNAPAE